MGLIWGFFTVSRAVSANDFSPCFPPWSRATTLCTSLHRVLIPSSLYFGQITTCPSFAGFWGWEKCQKTYFLILDLLNCSGCGLNSKTASKWNWFGNNRSCHWLLEKDRNGFSRTCNCKKRWVFPPKKNLDTSRKLRPPEFLLLKRFNSGSRKGINFYQFPRNIQSPGDKTTEQWVGFIPM